MFLPQGVQHLRGVQRQAVHEEGPTRGAPRWSFVAGAVQCLHELHADNITIMASGVKPATLCGPLSAYLDELHHWMQERNLCLCEKVHDDPFHQMEKEVRSQLSITVDSHQLPSNRTTRVLGVTLDPLLTFSQHITNSCKKVSQPNNILKKLAGFDWGCIRRSSSPPTRQ